MTKSTAFLTLLLLLVSSSCATRTDRKTLNLKCKMACKFLVDAEPAGVVEDKECICRDGTSIPVLPKD